LTSRTVSFRILVLVEIDEGDVGTFARHGDGMARRCRMSRR
jgi:hypothetical protein